MSNDLKPVRCGCGGEARTGKIYGDAWTVECTECGIQSGCYDTEAEAITAWNRAMGEQNKKKDMTFHWIESFLGYRCSSCGHICNTTAMPDICPNCHARLEWN